MKSEKATFTRNREEELYYELMDLIRSPEVLKIITGSSVSSKSIVRRDSKSKTD